MGEILRSGKSIKQLNLEELQKIRKEAQDTTKLAWFSLRISVVAIIVALIK